MFINESKKIHREKEAHDYWIGAFDEQFEDTQRHFLMLSYALPVLKINSAKKILTIGDSRARDAAFFKKKIGCYSVASDLSTAHIMQAKLDGHVDDVVDVDVENIPYEADSFDYVIVKESFHHWPRPMMGFYECLRVAKSGVILIEPSDGISIIPSNYGNGGEYHDSYEEVGNYKYQISLREICKSAWALRLPGVIAKGFNDPYTYPLDIKKYITDKNALDLMGDKNERPYNLMFICVNKIEYEFSDLETLGYINLTRPINPFEG
ncbi:class I SAM-dependent methyltransferase [Polynucleobacter paneuropaeus]|nr:class I SAM-dependent methyltransferase [Polynucleobacter paneuropaeus]